MYKLLLTLAILMTGYGVCSDEQFMPLTNMPRGVLVRIGEMSGNMKYLREVNREAARKLPSRPDHTTPEFMTEMFLSDALLTRTHDDFPSLAETGVPNDVETLIFYHVTRPLLEKLGLQKPRRLNVNDPEIAFDETKVHNFIAQLSPQGRRPIKRLIIRVTTDDPKKPHDYKWTQFFHRTIELCEEAGIRFTFCEETKNDLIDKLFHFFPVKPGEEYDLLMFSKSSRSKNDVFRPIWSKKVKTALGNMITTSLKSNNPERIVFVARWHGKERLFRYSAILRFVDKYKKFVSDGFLTHLDDSIPFTLSGDNSELRDYFIRACQEPVGSPYTLLDTIKAALSAGLYPYKVSQDAIFGDRIGNSGLYNLSHNQMPEIIWEIKDFLHHPRRMFCEEVLMNNWRYSRGVLACPVSIGHKLLSWLTTLPSDQQLMALKRMLAFLMLEDLVHVGAHLAHAYTLLKVSKIARLSPYHFDRFIAYLPYATTHYTYEDNLKKIDRLSAELKIWQNKIDALKSSNGLKRNHKAKTLHARTQISYTQKELASLHKAQKAIKNFRETAEKPINIFQSTLSSLSDYLSIFCESLPEISRPDFSD